MKKRTILGRGSKSQLIRKKGSHKGSASASAPRKPYYTLTLTNLSLLDAIGAYDCLPSDLQKKLKVVEHTKEFTTLVDYIDGDLC